MSIMLNRCATAALLLMSASAASAQLDVRFGEYCAGLPDTSAEACECVASVQDANLSTAEQAVYMYALMRLEERAFEMPLIMDFSRNKRIDVDEFEAHTAAFIESAAGSCDVSKVPPAADASCDDAGVCTFVAK